MGGSQSLALNDATDEAVIAANDRGYSTYAWAQPARLTLVPALESELAHV